MAFKRPKRIKDFDKYRVEDEKPTLIINGTWQEFHIKKQLRADLDLLRISS